MSELCIVLLVPCDDAFCDFSSTSMRAVDERPKLGSVPTRQPMDTVNVVDQLYGKPPAIVFTVRGENPVYQIRGPR